MPTQTLPTRTGAPPAEKLSRGFGLALGLHGLVLVGLVAAAWFSHRSNVHWGDRDLTAGAVQASMVSSLPLPPKQRSKDNEVLASDKPSIAPTPTSPAPVELKAKATPAPPKAEPPPKPEEVLIPTKIPSKISTKSAEKPNLTTAKPVDKFLPTLPTRTPPAPPTPKATTGETSGIQIPQSVLPMKNGTAAVSVDERSFGDRYAYYIKLINQAIVRSKQQEIDPPETRGKRTTIRFTIDRDGVPTEAGVFARSGSSALDISTLRAIQRIDGFGPLPAGDHLTVNFTYTSQ